MHRTILAGLVVGFTLSTGAAPKNSIDPASHSVAHPVPAAALPMIAGRNDSSRLTDPRYVEVSSRPARMVAAAVIRPESHPRLGAVGRVASHGLMRAAASFTVLPWHEPSSGVALASTGLDVVGRGGLVAPM